MYSAIHMKNIFEIGRVIQEMWSYGMIDDKIDEKELFKASLELAEQFEIDPEKDYYEEIYEFVVREIKERFGRDC